MLVVIQRELLLFLFLFLVLILHFLFVYNSLPFFLFFFSISSSLFLPCGPFPSLWLWWRSSEAVEQGSGCLDIDTELLFSHRSAAELLTRLPIALRCFPLLLGTSRPTEERRRPFDGRSGLRCGEVVQRVSDEPQLQQR